MEPIDIINELDAARLAKDKEKVIEKAWKDGSDDFFLGMHFAFDPFSSFGVSDIPYILEEDDEADILGIPKFSMLLERLRKREVTEVSALTAIDDALDVSSVEAWNKWYRRILLKDFKRVVTPAQINKVLSKFRKSQAKAIKYTIPRFGLQHAIDYDKQLLSGYALVDHFINGDRTLAILNKIYNTVSLLSEKGKHFADTKLTLYLTQLMQQMPISVVLDGIMQDHHYILLDIIPLTEYRKGYSYRSQEERHAALCDLELPLQDISGRLIRIHPKKKINLNNKDDFNSVINDASAFEVNAIVIKDITTPYIFRKSDNWLKFPIIVS